MFVYGDVVPREFMSVFLRVTIVLSSGVRLNGDSFCAKHCLVLLYIHRLLRILRISRFFGRCLHLVAWQNTWLTILLSGVFFGVDGNERIVAEALSVYGSLVLRLYYSFPMTF